MTAAEIASATGGTIVSGKREGTFSGVSIDSRTVKPGELFVAIRGARLDGHRYVAEAMAKGAAGAVVDAAWAPAAPTAPERAIVEVADTHRALKDLAAEVRRRWRGSLVAVTGSIGKTTTKEFAAHVLESEYSVYRSPGNYNNLFGLPLSLLGLCEADHIGVFEMGMSAPGEIAEMCRIARPDAGVLTAVAPVHLEFFASLDEIARAKGELADALDEAGMLVYNADDPRVAAIAERAVCRTISFGRIGSADVRADEIEIAGVEATRFRLTAFGETRRAVLQVAGLHYVANALAAVALGRHYRIALDAIVATLAELEHAPMRGAVVRFERGFAVIDDSYNSNPVALTRMMENLAATPAAGRRVVVAGAMRELGAASAALHFDCGAAAARLGIDLVVAVEGDAREIARGARESGMPEASVRFFDTPDEAAAFLLQSLAPGDLVLVKGSRGVRLERILEALRGGPGGA
jgi:UDP-N-acetylmuramoyl-tripeptide--D-alanyl-D-alanine ligase